MSLITRTFTFVDGTTAYGSQVDSEIANIVNTLNNLDAASKNWDQVSILNAVSVPLTADCSSGTQNIANFKNNTVVQAQIASNGEITIKTAGAGLVLTTPDGTKTFRLFIDNNGVFNTIELT